MNDRTSGEDKSIKVTIEHESVDLCGTNSCEGIELFSNNKPNPETTEGKPLKFILTEEETNIPTIKDGKRNSLPFNINIDYMIGTTTIYQITNYLKEWGRDRKNE